MSRITAVADIEITLENLSSTQTDCSLSPAFALSYKQEANQPPAIAYRSSFTNAAEPVEEAFPADLAGVVVFMRRHLLSSFEATYLAC
jgi:hypothetical protein